MNVPEITVRPARREDAPLLAYAVATAIGDEAVVCDYCGSDYIAVLTDIAGATGTQYSWQCALVAEFAGVVAGAVIGYDGARLGVLRNGTFAVLHERLGRVPAVADETEAGEYYLDTLCVLPEFRGRGIGRALLNAFCEKVFAEGHQCVGLIVDFNNPDAEKLYASLGFERVGRKQFFGHSMWHLQKKR